MNKFEGSGVYNSGEPQSAEEQLPHNHERIVELMMNTLINKNAITEEVTERAGEIERKCHKDNSREGFDPKVLLVVAMERYIEEHQEHLSKKLIASYEEWKQNQK